MKLLLTLVVALLLGGCVTYNKCLDKFGKLGMDSIPKTVVTNTPIAIPVPADSLSGAIPLDSLCDWYWNYTTAKIDSLTTVTDSLNTVSTTGKLSTQHWVDKYNKLLRFKTIKQIDTIHFHHRDTVKVNCPPVISFDQENKKVSGFRALWVGYQLFAAWALLVLLFVLIFLKQIKKLFS